MIDTEQVGVPPEKSLRRHVLSPISISESVLDGVYEEVDAERHAFEQFKGRVAAGETVSTASAAPATRAPLSEKRSRAADRLRSAYRETVMNVDHYDEVYGESLVENIAAELSRDIAARLRRDAHMQFTPFFKRTLLTAVASAIDQRKTFCEILDGEHDSLTRSRNRLLAILDELDGVRVPAGVEVDFTDALDEVAHDRQATFAGRTASPRTDGHDLCGYLYTHCDWTYPVLTAVTRLRGAVNGVVT